jgi:hypothetical protein
VYKNELKELPYTIELDWNSGNIFLNIPSINSKLVLDKKAFESISDTMNMSKNRNLLRTIKVGDVFYVGNKMVQYKILDVTSTVFYKFNEGVDIAEEVIDYVDSGTHLGVNVCVNHSKEETHVFICDAATKEPIFGNFVVAAMIIDGEVEKIIAKPFSEMNRLMDDDSFLYKRI